MQVNYVMIQPRPLFSSFLFQLRLICEKLGKPLAEDLDFVSSDKARKFLAGLPNSTSPPLENQFSGTPPDAVDLLKKMLQINPKKRITVDDALMHPFFNSIRDPRDMYTTNSVFDYSFENQTLDRIRLKELIWEEMINFRPGCLPVPSRREDDASVSSRNSRGRKWMLGGR